MRDCTLFCEAKQGAVPVFSRRPQNHPDTTVTGIGGHDAASCPPIPVTVVISTPAAQHYALATQALDAGKHCFVEKPLALAYDEGAALGRLAEAKKKILFVGHILQYHPAVVRLKELINKGTIGSDYRHYRIYGIVETSIQRTHDAG